MTTAHFPGLSLADAEREIDSHIFSRSPEQDHEAKLRRVTRALHYLGDPQDTLRVIHITGTNGKTSTSRMIESLLRAHGLRTGLFTSPHLHTLRERIQIDGEPLAQDELVRLWQHVAPAVHRVDTYSLRIGGPRMSFFEVLTVLGIVAYADARVQVAVIEVGIGGQRDATNAVDGEVAVLTPMGLDHDKYFVGGIAGVAREKSGIIKPGATVVSAAQVDEAAAIIAQAASSRRAPTWWEGIHLEVRRRQVVAGGQALDLATTAANYPDVFVPLHGAFQAQNALVALAACEVFIGRGVPRTLDQETVRAGFAAASSPGRLEVVATEPTIIIDAAHNPHGVAALAASLDETFGFERLVGVVAVLADKDYRGILVGLEPLVERVVVTQSSSHRAAAVEDLAIAARDVFGEERVTVAPDIGLAIDMARAIARPAFEGEMSGVLVAGSITLVSEVRKVLDVSGTSAPEPDIAAATDGAYLPLH